MKQRTWDYLTSKSTARSTNLDVGHDEPTSGLKNSQVFLYKG